MKPDPKPRTPEEEVEIRLTAWLLGELDPAEAAALGRQVAAEPRLSALLERLQPVVRRLQELGRLERETAAERLSEPQREKVLRALAAPPPSGKRKEASRSSRPSFWLLRIEQPWAVAAVVVVCLLLMAGMLLPAFSKAKAKSKAVARLHAERLRELARQMAEEDARLEREKTHGFVAGEDVVAEGDRRFLGSDFYHEKSQKEAAKKDAAAASSLEKRFSVSRDAPREALGEKRKQVAHRASGSGAPAAGKELSSLLTPPTPRAAAPRPAAPSAPGGAAGSIPGESLSRRRARGAAPPPARARYGAAANGRAASAATAEPAKEEHKWGFMGMAATREAAAEPVQVQVLAETAKKAETVEKEKIAAAAVEGILELKRIGSERMSLEEASPTADKSRVARRGRASRPAQKVKAPEQPARLPAKPRSAPVPALKPTVPLRTDALAAGVKAPKPRPPRPAFELKALPEVDARKQPFSTFSLNVSDVSFRLAAAALEQNRFPDPSRIRSEEFVNAMDYRDPTPRGRRAAVYWERARHPFAHDREAIRIAVKTAASGRERGRPMNLTIVLDRSGSMERADRVRITREALRVLAKELGPQDRVSVATFALRAHLRADGVPGDQAAKVFEEVCRVAPEGGTDLEAALRLGYETAARHFIPGGVNRVVLLTDGAANLGNVDAAALAQMVQAQRRRGIALDAFGIGWEGYNDQMLETLTRHGDGRYGFLNSVEDVREGFARRLAGALRVAAADVKVQVEFNPEKVKRYRQVGYELHRLTKEQFRDNAVDAAEIGAAEAGNALYIVQTDPAAPGPLGWVRVRYRIPETGRYEEQEYVMSARTPPPKIGEASPSIRLAVAAASFAEWLARSPYAGEVTPRKLLDLMRGLPELYKPDPRPALLEQMIRRAAALAGMEASGAAAR